MADEDDIAQADEQARLTDLQDQESDADERAPTPVVTPQQAVPTLRPRAPGPEPIAPGAQPIFADFGGSAAPSGQHGELRSFGDQVWASTLQMGQGLLGAASLATRKLSENPDAVAWIEQQRRNLGDHIAATTQAMSPKAQLALHSSLFGDGSPDAPTPGEVGWGHYIGATIASVLPQAALAVLPGGVLVRASSKLLEIAGASAETAAKAGSVAGFAGAPAAFGAQQAGDAYNALVDSVDKAKPDELMQSPVYAQLRQQGMSDTDARKALVGQIATPFAAAQFAVGAAAGAGVGSLLTRGAAGAAGASLLRRAGVGAAEGAATMGLQSGAGDLLQQAAGVQAGTQADYDPVQTAKALASGTLGGAVLGAAGGALHRGGEAAPVATEPEAPGVVPSEQQAAVNEALQQTPESSAPAPRMPWPIEEPTVVNPGDRPALTFNPDRAQGEGFTVAPAPTVPEPVTDIKAQLQQLANPDSTRDAVFVAKGTPMPRNIPQGVMRVLRPEGTLLTTNTAKAALFRKGPVDDTRMAHILGFPETKQEAMASGAPRVVQAKDAAGNVVSEMLASPQGENTARAAAAGQAPGAEVQSVSPEEAVQRRLITPVPDEAHPVEKAAAQVEEPTPAQAEAGNYQKGHLSLQGLDVTIETPKGGVRKGPLDETGKPAWQATMPAHYGYIRGTKGGDGEHVDVQLGPRTKALFDGTPEQAANEPVFVVDQIDPRTGKFDEHKALVGFHTELEATRAYDTSFTDGSGPSRRGAVTEMPFAQFKEWLKGDTTKPVTYKRPTVGAQLRKREAERQRMAGAMRPEERAAVPESLVALKTRQEGEARTPYERQEITAAADRLHVPAQQIIEAVKDRPAGSLTRRAIKDAAIRLMPKITDEEIAANSAAADEIRATQAKEEALSNALSPSEARQRKELEGGIAKYIFDDRNEANTLRMRQAQAKLGAFLSSMRNKYGLGDEEAREEVEHQPQVYEHETAGPTTVVSPEEAAAEKLRSPQTSNLDRKLSDLESKVLNKILTPEEAEKEYGPARVGGRPRKFATFADWLRDRIAKAEDPEVERGIVRQMEELQKQPPGPKRAAAVRLLNQELDRTGKDYADQLREALNQIENPEKAEADRQARQAARLAKLKNLRKKSASMPAGERMVKMYQDPDVNRPVRELIDKIHSESRSVSVHDFLDRVITAPVVKGMLPHAAEYAKLLKRLLPADMQVMSQMTATARFGDSDYLRPQDAGTFYPAFAGEGGVRPPMITLNPDSTVYSPVDVLLHEATHAVTFRYIERLMAEKAATKQVPRDIQILGTIGNEFHRIYMERFPDAANETHETPMSPEDARLAHEIAYTVSDPHELVSMLMTSPDMYRVAAEAAPSEAFRQAMFKFGYARQESRSLWSSFTGWLRRVLGLKPDSNTLLDHIARPLQDFIDRAHQYNQLVPDRELQAVASPAMDAASRALPRLTKDDVLRHIDTRRVGDTMRRVLLGGATTDGIVNWNRELFKAGKENSLEAYRTATEAWAAASTKFRDDYADQVSKLVKDFSGLGPERDKLAQLMNDATIAEVHLAGGSNDHLKSREQLAALKSLQSRYDALSPKAKAVYQGLRDYYRKTYDQERTAQLGAMIKTALPGATRAQVQALAEAARTKRGINQLIDRPDASAVATAFAEAWHDNRALVRGIAKVHSQGFVQGDYFPLRRFGDYVVHYGTKGTDDYGVEMFEKRYDADQRRAELERAGAEPSQVLDKRRSYLRALVPTTVMDELEQAVRTSPRLSGAADEVRDLFASILLQHMSRSEAARSRMRRQGVLGASTDHERILAQDFLSTASRIGYLERGPDRAAALAAMRRHADYLGRNGAAGEQIRAQAVLNELEKRQPSGDDASGTLTGLARKFSAMGFVYSLMSPSHMATATIEAHMNSTALLGARHGAARAGLVLAKALKDITPAMTSVGARSTIKSVGEGLKHADWNMANLARDKFIEHGADKLAMTDLFNRLNGAGLIDHSIVREMQRIARPGADVTKGWWDRFLDFNTVAAHAVDVANKSAIAKAAYDLELRKTGDHDKAARYAVEMARTAMPNYNVGNKARIATAQGVLGGFAGPLTQFKQYGLHIYSVMANLVRASLNGATRQERVEARKAFAGILATHAMMAGALTLFPDPLKWVLGAYDWIVGGLDKPHNYENDMRAWVASAFGPELGEVISRGLPHAVGIDIHRRVGLANLLELPELKSFNASGFGDMIAAAMTGAAGEDATQMAGSINKVMHGDVMGAVKALTPRVFRDPIKAFDLANRGVVDTRGRTILPPDKLTLADEASQFVGFQPSRVTEFREGRAAVMEAREEAKTLRDEAINAFVTGNRQSALDQVRAYNQQHPEQPITYSQLLQAAKRATAQARPGAYGLMLPKKTVGTLERAGSFANQ